VRAAGPPLAAKGLVVTVPPAGTVALQAEGAVQEAVRPAGAPARGAEVAVARGSPEGSSVKPPPAPAAARTQARIEFVERILQAAKLTQSQGQTRMRTVLNPPHLGGLKVQLTVQEHVLHGTLRAEQPAARDLIVQHLQSLKDALEQQGIQVGEFHVDVDPGADRNASERRHGAGDGSATPHGPPPPQPRQTEGTEEERALWPRSARWQLVDLVA